MGLTTVDIEIANPATPENGRMIEFLVDSGAMFPVVPTPILNELGIKPIAEQKFRLADGSTIRRKKGSAVYRYRDNVGTADVIFGETGDYTLFGALGLEALGLAIHPFKRELFPLPMILA
jgi:predicted aspartyl protease